LNIRSLETAKGLIPVFGLAPTLIRSVELSSSFIGCTSLLLVLSSNYYETLPISSSSLMVGKKLGLTEPSVIAELCRYTYCGFTHPLSTLFFLFSHASAWLFWRPDMKSAEICLSTRLDVGLSFELPSESLF
jgi:hypothetical protein